MEAELQSLRDEVATCRESLEQWTQAEVEWTQQRRLFQIMTENVSDLIVLLDHQGNRTWTNPAYSHVMGYLPEELTGKHALGDVHPDDMARATEALNLTLQDGSTHQA